jgi:hypothetical protein
MLDGAGVLAVIGKFKAGGMPQHVRVDGHAQLGRLSGARDQLMEGSGGHRCAALGEKDIGGFRVVAQHLAQGAQFRSAAYADGASRGAPEAVQVADRFHLLQNLVEALELAFTAQARELRDIEQARRRAAAIEGVAVRPAPPPSPKRPLALAVARREQRLATHRRVWELWREGWPGHDIARHLGIGRTTTYRYLRSEAFPERKGRSDAGRSSVDPWGAWVIARWNAGQHNGRQMLRELALS